MEIIQNAWLFFQNQILGMQWPNALIGKGLSALVVDGKVLSSGRVLSPEEAAKLLKDSLS